MKADLRARNFSEALDSCATGRVPPRDRAGSTLLRAWARSRARRKSHEACPNEEIDRLYFFEAHRDGVIVALILPLGAVQQASRDSCVEIRGFDPLAACQRESEWPLSLEKWPFKSRVCGGRGVSVVFA